MVHICTSFERAEHSAQNSPLTFLTRVTESTYIKLFFYIHFTCIPSIYQIHYKIGGTPPHSDGGQNISNSLENLTSYVVFDADHPEILDSIIPENVG